MGACRGPIITSVRTADSKACLDECTALPDCAWFSFEQESGKCQALELCEDLETGGTSWLTGESTCPDPRVVSEFSDLVLTQQLADGENTQFKNLVVDKNSGTVYIGGVNMLYQLSPNLDLLVSSKTGPKKDSPECFPANCPPFIYKELSNNINKALVIDYSNSRLIDCGSLFQGYCTVRSMQNISHIQQEYTQEPLVANDGASSTVAFIAPGPPNPPLTQVMYFGVTYTGNGPYRSEVPAISSRSLDSTNLFKPAQMSTTSTRMFLNSLARERYPINYIYGFSSDGFSYFLTTQMKTTSPNSQYHSRIVRVCHNDQDYFSYTEVPLQCVSQSGLDYSLIQAAYNGKPGSDLADSMDVTIQDDVLFAAFSTPKEEGGRSKAEASKGSALCVYSLKSIRRTFAKNIEKCMKGEGKTGLDFIMPSRQCTNTGVTNISEDFCGLGVNTPLLGQTPVKQTPVLTFNSTTLTALTATSFGNRTVSFLGTSEGHLKKALISSTSSGFEFDDITIAQGMSVRSELLFDQRRDHIYVMTDKKLSKVHTRTSAGYPL